VNRFRTPRNRNVVFFARCAGLLLAAFALAFSFTGSLFGQAFARPDGSIPVPLDWSSKHVVFTGDYMPEQAAKTWNEPRAYAQWLLHGNAPEGSGLVRWRPTPKPRRRSRRPIKKDWAISLGAGGVAQGMSPAKFSFDVNATPSCTTDFAVFPINATTGNTRSNVVGTFTGEPTSGQTTSITITPTGGTAVTLTLTASSTTNTGLDFEVSITLATDAADLAAAINRNLSSAALDRVVAVASGATVTVYALTPGGRVTLTTANSLTNFSWGTVTAGTNGAQANIVAFNQLYSGSGTSLCNLPNPEFIFSYASGVGPVATSPGLSLNGTEIAYVENDPNIGAILHVLTFGSGSTEYGTSASCANNNNGGATLPTCATNAVIPGSTSGSTATDFMLPLGLVAANATTGLAGAADSFSSPFTDYANDTIYVGDNNGFLYAITPTFNATPAYAGGNFPVHVSPSPATLNPTAITATTTTVTVTVNNSLSIGELVTISGETNGANGCGAADQAALNAIQTVVSASATKFTFNGTNLNQTTGTGCSTAGVTIMPGSNFLSLPVVDVGDTGNIFVGDSSSNLYELTPAGATAATALALGVNGGTNQGAINGGIRDGAIIDSTNGVGYVETACNPNTTGEMDTGTTGNTGLVQFTFSSNTLTAVVYAGLDTGANQSCMTAGFPDYAPTPDQRYYALGISSATAANNGEIIAATSGTGGQQLKELQFVSSTMQATPQNLDKPQLGTNASPISPLTEFYNSQVFNVTGVTASTTVVTVTATNTLAVNDLVTLSGVAVNAANNCTAPDIAAIAAINGGIQTVVSATATSFTFDVAIPNATTGAGCTVTGATATGGPDYLFVGVNENPSAVYSLLLPNSLLVASGATPTSLATNTTDAVGGTSGIIVDNDSTAGQASSIYFGTLATSTTVCGNTAAYCAVKLTQSGLQ
jgi:hypothetical protein